MSEKILIVDDDLETIRLIGMVLQRQGYQIVTATNGTEALSLALKEQPNLILLDLMMPDMDGYETLREIRKDARFRSLPILALTAKAMKGDRETIMAHGFDGYISKPIDAELLKKILHEALD